jgi:hypothetical protein
MQELIEALRARKVILFAGAGLSMNLGLPSSSSLTEHLAEELGFDPEVFQLAGDYLSLTEYYLLQKGSLAPLKSWMDQSWHRPEIDIGQSAIYRAIVDLHFPIIYTTNYDCWLERAFEAACTPYTKIADVADIVHAKENVTQVVKLHGDLEGDTPIVLTESSYMERLSFESPLDIKLRADALGRSILFLGYSVSDINIRYLLYRLHRQWQNAPSEAGRPRSYIFLIKPNPVQETVLRARGIEPIVSEEDDAKKALERFLHRLLCEVSRESEQ